MVQIRRWLVPTIERSIEHSIEHSMVQIPRRLVPMMTSPTEPCAGNGPIVLSLTMPTWCEWPGSLRASPPGVVALPCRFVGLIPTLASASRGTSATPCGGSPHPPVGVRRSLDADAGRDCDADAGRDANAEGGRDCDADAGRDCDAEGGRECVPVGVADDRRERRPSSSMSASTSRRALCMRPCVLYDIAVSVGCRRLACAVPSPPSPTVAPQPSPTARCVGGSFATTNAAAALRSSTSLASPSGLGHILVIILAAKLKGVGSSASLASSTRGGVQACASTCAQTCTQACV